MSQKRDGEVLTSSDFETIDPRLYAIVLRWEELYKQGRSLSVEELCLECPDLVGEVARRIEALRAMEAPLRTGETTDPDLETGTASSPDGNRAAAICRSVYDELRFHASGGLGEVFLARGGDLGRDVALKFLRRSRAAQAESRYRFLREARLTGGLEHPGVVPIYGLGADDEGHPCYAMRFIQGETLEQKVKQLHSGNGPVDLEPELRKVLRRFLSACQTVAYAHSKGVLHRDIKPANLMLGPFEETLVIDWGLAKRFGSSQVDIEEGPASGTDAGDESEAPTYGVVGTPAFMSPEQADERRAAEVGPASDVYSLGATLYTILTGQSPFAGQKVWNVLELVKKGEFPRPRQINTRVPRPLEAICLKAMALRPDDRYKTPSDLAADVEHWLAGEPVSVYRDPWQVRLARWAKKHRTTLATAGSAAIVAALLLGGVTWVRIAQRERVDASAQTTLGQAEAQAIKARVTGDLTDWEKAVAEAKLAEARLDSGGGSPDLRREVATRLEGFQAEQARRWEALDAEKKDRDMVASLDEARLLSANAKDDGWDHQAKNDAYLAAFRSYGIDVALLSIDEAARRIRSSRVVDHLISSLDDWAGSKPLTISVPHLVEIARAAEPDADRAAIRDLIARGDSASLRRLSESAEGRRKLGPRLVDVFESMRRLDPQGSFRLLETILRENPSDFWLNIGLGSSYLSAKPRQVQEAVRFLSVAVALRPNSPAAHTTLGVALHVQGKIDKAIAEFRDAIRHNPDYSVAHNNLGFALQEQGELDLAVAEYQEAIRHSRPDDATAHYNLGNAYKAQGKFDLAIDEYRKSIRIQADYKSAHFNLGNTLKDQGKLDLAIAEYREEIKLNPTFSQAHNNLATALKSQRKLDDAIAEYREAIRLQPDDPDPHNGLGIVLEDQGKLDEAITESREAIRLKPDYVEAHTNLGNALKNQGRLDLAIASYSEAIRLKPTDAAAYCNLGGVLATQGMYRDALKNIERGHELGSRQPGWRYPSADWVRIARRLVELEAKIPTILRGEAKPTDADERLELAVVCYRKGLHAVSARFADEAFAEKPELANNPQTGTRYNAACSASLAGSGQGKDDPMPDEAAQAKLREQAVGWLWADLACWAKILEGGNLADRKQLVARNLAHWKEDADLAAIRDPEGLAKLPESEQKELRALWTEVDQMLAKARTGAP